MQTSTMEFFWTLLIVIGLAIVFYVYIAHRSPKKSLDTSWYNAQWHSIETTLNDGHSGQVLAIINADKLLDNAMKQKGIRGQNMGERLKNSGSHFHNLNAVWSAHKLRNRIAHETNIQIDQQEVRRALKAIQEALRNIGAF
jgi:hypothetical protein